MKLLLDENLPHDLRHFLPGHQVFTTAFMGWCGIKNGQLLRRATDGGFDALLSLDSGIAFQHNLKSLPCAVVIIRAKSNKLADVQAVLTELLDALLTLSPRTIIHVG